MVSAVAGTITGARDAGGCRVTLATTGPRGGSPVAGDARIDGPFDREGDGTSGREGAVTELAGGRSKTSGMVAGGLTAAAAELNTREASADGFAGAASG
jgi:hypothetical protein